MKKIFFIIAAVLFTGVLCGGDFVITPKCQVQIVIPDKLQHTVMELALKNGASRIANALKFSFGKNVPVVKEKNARKGIKTIYIGKTAAAQKLKLKKLTGFNYAISASGNALYIAGNDSPRMTKIHNPWRSPQDEFYLGSLRGMVDFSEKYLGTAFLWPGEIGTDYARKKMIRVPAGTVYSADPLFQFANAGFPTFNDVCYDYSLGWYGRGGYQVYGGHSIRNINTLAKGHPEYYALIGGVRRTKGHNIHFCLSNPAVLDLYHKVVARAFDEGVECYEIGVDDSFQPCQCAKCKAIHPDVSEYVWDFYRRLAEKFAETHPQKKLMFIAYQATQMPPKSFKAFPGNVVIELTKYSKSFFEAWKNFSNVKEFHVYIYNWGNFLMPGLTPKRTPEYLENQIKLFRKYNVQGIYRCGFGQNYGLEGVLYYLYGRLMRSRNVNVKIEIDKFYDRAFHESAAPMREFFSAIHRQLNYFNRLSGEQQMPGEKDYYFSSVLLPKPADLVLMLWPAEHILLLERYLTSAERIAKDPKVRKRLELIRIEFEYVKHLVRALRTYAVYQDLRTKEAFDMVDKAVTARRKFMDKYYDKKGISKLMPGWPEIRLFGGSVRHPQHGTPRSMAEVNGRLSAIIQAPLTLDFSNYRKLRQLPDASKKSIVARYTKTAPPNDIRDQRWKRVKWDRINQLTNAPKSKGGGWFKVLYDDNNLYVLIQSAVPAARKYASLGRSRSVSGIDSAEIFIDPTGTGSRYFHFIVNPVANSYQDGAFGLIKSALDPRYNTYVSDWDGKWRYMTRRLHPVKSRPHHWWVTFVIPFKTLGVKKPEPGMVWNLDVARVQFATPRDWRSAELFLWSGPNSKFHDRTKFGELVFEK